MFQAGSIRKIEVKNFVTYSYCEMYPGPNLNMIIGPNGSGKSTIVAAVILGLGGNAKVVGRGHKVSDYVKHECDEASITIYLQGNRESEFIKISRKFTKSDKSSWYLNNQKVNAAEIMECTKQFNIQVDNLCQFLPQDRVQDFAKLNQKELLREVQVALCRSDLLDVQAQLVECRENHKKLSGAIEKNDTKLQETREANVRLEGKVINFNKKKEYMRKVQDIDRKLAWLQYDSAHEKLVEVKGDLKKAQEVYDRYKNEIKPSERDIEQKKRKIAEWQKGNSSISRVIRESEDSIRHNLELFENEKLAINEVNNEMLTKIDEIQHRHREIRESSDKIEQMRVAQRALVEKAGNDEDVRLKVQRLTSEMQNLKKHVTGLENKKEEIIRGRQNAVAQLRASENEIARIENVKQQRLQYLRKLDSDAYDACLWLRQNKNLFKGEVFEPILMEINVLDPDTAQYVENVIALRDKVAFGCVLQEDMNTFIRYMRNDRNLRVNVFHASDSGSSTRYQPAIPIEHLRKYGLYSYLRSLFTAPEPIMNYLCQFYRVHNIPVGNKDTNQYYQQIPNEIRVFFSDDQRYSVNVSRYTGEKSIQQNQIRADGSLSICVDVLRLEDLKGRITDLRNNVLKCDNHLKELDTQVQLINEKCCKLGDELKHIQNLKQQASLIEGRINAMLRRIEEMRQAVSSPEIARNEAKQKILKIIRKMKPIQEEVKKNYKSLTTLSQKSTLSSVQIEKSRKLVAFLENKIKETRRLMGEAEATYNQVKEAHMTAKAQARTHLQKAKSLSKNFNPEEDGFNEFRPTFDKLSSDIAELQEDKNQLTAMIECLNTADTDEIREYEERVQLIEELERKIEKANSELAKISSQMDSLEKEWLAPLNQLLEEINLKFGSAFEKMGCAGEVSLNRGDDEKDFANYGLRIKVTYRNGEPLQELNNIVQSGGERAVATAAFMLSLQELTPVPFRCVDEINQGMDPSNEKRIMDLLIESTESPNTPQYFLITPKLVPNLSYSRSMMVHIVHNGEHVEEDAKWRASKLCNPLGVTNF